MSDKPDEDGRESNAQEEHVPEGEIIYRAIRRPQLDAEFLSGAQRTLEECHHA